MQKVAAYLLERRDDMKWPEARTEEVERLKNKTKEWLRLKGAHFEGSSGTYKPEDGGPEPT